MKAKPTALIISGESSTALLLRSALEQGEYGVVIADSAESGLEKLAAVEINVVLLAIQLPDMGWETAMKELKLQWPAVPVVVITEPEGASEAKDAIRLGAEDFIEKPLSNERVLLTVSNTLRLDELERKQAVTSTLNEGFGDAIVGESESIVTIKREIAATAPTMSRVLILGENGTGKHLVARALHRNSKRAKKPFIRVNCAAIPEELLESELFGYVRGAIDGATAASKGKLLLADGGTIFLDEISSLNLEMQSKLLRVLQDGEFEPLGSDATLSIDVRVVSATGEDLESMMSTGAFRRDLFYRLAVIPVHLPPLRKRLSDIPQLVDFFLRSFGPDIKAAPIIVDEAAYDYLKDYGWPGNVRELRNIVERLMIIHSGKIITEKDVQKALKIDDAESELSFSFADDLPLRQMVADYEKAAIVNALARNSNHVSNTARDLGIERSHLYKKMRAYQILPRS